VCEFPGPNKRARKTKERAIRFVCIDYAFLHYNYKYDRLRPTLEEIVSAYMKVYGKESRESDIESDGSSGAEGVEEEDRKDDGVWQCEEE
jgi:hypothetical protein